MRGVFTFVTVATWLAIVLAIKLGLLAVFVYVVVLVLQLMGVL